MKICLLSMEYPPEKGWGGIGKYTYNLAHGLEKLGQDVTVISSSYETNQHYSDGSIDIFRLKLNRYPLSGPTVFPFNACKQVLHLLSKKHFEVIEAPLTFAEGLALSFIKVRPLVISLHTPSFIMSEIYGLPNFISSRWEIVEKTTLRRADRIISNTIANASLITDRYKLNPSKLSIIPHGIDLQKYVDHKLYEKNNELKRNKVVLFVGRLEKRKGVDILLKAIPSIIKRYPAVVFVFVGADSQSSPNGKSYKKYILEQAELYGYTSNILLVGRASEEQLVDYYYGCDIFVSPSRYESFGLVYLEAMACSKPVIGTDIGGIPEVINNELTGCLFPLADSQALAEALLDLLFDEKKCKRLGENGRKSVESNFTDTIMAEKTLKVFNELI